MVKFFDRLEDFVREHLSRFPITYSIIGGIAVVLFWRAVWETADMLSRQDSQLAFIFYPPVQMVLSISVLLVTGLMVSTFIGDRIILSGLRHEKKMEEKTKELVKEEVITLKHLRDEIRELKKQVEDLTKK